MTDPLRDALRELMEKWRKEASDALAYWPRGAILPSMKLRACADDLDALLAREARPTTMRCAVCEMGTDARGKTSAHGQPVQVICNSCLDNEVRHDPRGVREARPAPSLTEGLRVRLRALRIQFEQARDDNYEKAHRHDIDYLEREAMARAQVWDVAARCVENTAHDLDAFLTQAARPADPEGKELARAPTALWACRDCGYLHDCAGTDPEGPHGLQQLRATVQEWAEQSARQPNIMVKTAFAAFRCVLIEIERLRSSSVEARPGAGEPVTEPAMCCEVYLPGYPRRRCGTTPAVLITKGATTLLACPSCEVAMAKQGYARPFPAPPSDATKEQ